MNILELLFGQIPEAIYFALFLILTKQLKEKRMLFITIMIIEYVLSMNLQVFSIWSHIVYVILMYISLKLLYKERAQITDIFTFGIASIGMIVSSAIVFLVFGPDNMLLVSSINNMILFIGLALLYKKLPYIQIVYKKLWNRKFENNLKLKSTTFRCINLVIFNFMFYAINLGMIYALLIRK